MVAAVAVEVDMEVAEDVVEVGAEVAAMRAEVVTEVVIAATEVAVGAEVVIGGRADDHAWTARLLYILSHLLFIVDVARLSCMAFIHWLPSSRYALRFATLQYLDDLSTSTNFPRTPINT